MNNQPLPPATLNSSQQPFCIHEKLKANNSHWSYAFAASPAHGEGNYRLVTEWSDNVEYGLYKRVDGYFILIDFFSDIDEACSEAKKILCKIPKFEKSISAMAGHIY